ncbi:MAG TPA: tRNA-dependent cyclodipeptide synthase [Bryobacteraceae bacterium]|nr:tRNA-dependent cyclodipeptide synthase [Bryobacteraceae bacterium]
MMDELVLYEDAGLEPASLRPMNGYLGVSFSMTKFFSRERMRQYIEWAGANLQDLLIIVADHFEGYNIEVFKRSEPETAFPKAFGVGYQLLKGYVRAIPKSLESRVRVVLASELLIEQQCIEILESVRRLGSQKPDFVRDCRTGILELISGKLAEAGIEDAQRESALEVLLNYMYEEIAIILYVSHAMSPPYPVAIFPYEPRQVIRNLYQNQYGDISAITRGEAFRFVRLAPPSFVRASAAGGGALPDQ